MTDSTSLPSSSRPPASPQPSLTTLICPVRGTEQPATPEERVRYALLNRMINELGYPKTLLSVERALDQVPHLAHQPHLPDRRFDIVCFGNAIHPDHALYPLLLIECKAVSIHRQVLDQVCGYNHYLQAYFIAVANQTETRTGWYDRDADNYVYIERLPAYSELLEAIRGS